MMLYSLTKERYAEAVSKRTFVQKTLFKKLRKIPLNAGMFRNKTLTISVNLRDSSSILKSETARNSASGNEKSERFLMAKSCELYVTCACLLMLYDIFRWLIMWISFSVPPFTHPLLQ